MEIFHSSTVILPLKAVQPTHAPAPPSNDTDHPESRTTRRADIYHEPTDTQRKFIPAQERHSKNQNPIRTVAGCLSTDFRIETEYSVGVRCTPFHHEV